MKTNSTIMKKARRGYFWAVTFFVLLTVVCFSLSCNALAVFWAFLACFFVVGWCLMSKEYRLHLRLVRQWQNAPMPKLIAWLAFKGDEQEALLGYLDRQSIKEITMALSKLPTDNLSPAEKEQRQELTAYIYSYLID